MGVPQQDRASQGEGFGLRTLDVLAVDCRRDAAHQRAIRGPNADAYRSANE